MKIREMFEEDIERPINGVVQVEQEQESVVKQEVKEYVVTTELKKHFAKFFNEYSESFDETVCFFYQLRFCAVTCVTGSVMIARVPICSMQLQVMP